MKPQIITDKHGFVKDKARKSTNIDFRLFFQFLCVLCVLCGSTALTAAQKKNTLGWVWQNPLPQGNPLYSIHFTKDKETGYAVGADSTILRTDDGGFSWLTQKLPIDTTISGVFVKDKKNAVVVGARGLIFLTSNGGSDWRQIVV